MPATIPALTLLLAAGLASASFPRRIAARYPGLQSFSRWVALTSLAAGSAAAAASILLAGLGIVDMHTALVLASTLVILAQGCGSLVLKNWMPNTQAEIVCDEQALFHSLTALTAFVS